jgi:hypothetical protein
VPGQAAVRVVLEAVPDANRKAQERRIRGPGRPPFHLQPRRLHVCTLAHRDLVRTVIFFGDSYQFQMYETYAGATEASLSLSPPALLE